MLCELIPDYETLKEQARDNLLSSEEIEIKIEYGTFGQIKQNMNYERIRRRRLERVSCKVMLMCLGRNVKKYFILLNQN